MQLHDLSAFLRLLRGWMGEGTKTEALRKLANLEIQIGHPRDGRDYRGLQIEDHDLLGNIVRTRAFDWKRRVHNLGKPRDKSDWRFWPQYPTAYTENNQLIFTAGMLQPPFLGDNIADLGGVTIALAAYCISLHGSPAPVIDGYTGEQRLFLCWAQSWREKIRDDALRRMVASDVHSPALDRVDGVVRNMDAWYTAFDVMLGETLYLEPSDRVDVW